MASRQNCLETGLVSECERAPPVRQPSPGPRSPERATTRCVSHNFQVLQAGKPPALAPVALADRWNYPRAMPQALKTADNPAPAARFQPYRERNPHHVPKRFRSLFGQPSGPEIAERALRIVWPWGRAEYPGLGRLRGWLMGGVSVKTADRYRRALPRSRARVMADRLEGIASGILAMVAELRAYADGGPAAGSLSRPKVPPPAE